MDGEGAANLVGFAEGGGTLTVGFHSGAVDANCHVRLGGYPGAFREVLGVRADELFPLLPGESVGLGEGRTGSLWSERLRLEGVGAEAVLSYEDGPLAGVPAVTRNSVGAGVGWYVATRPDASTLGALLGRMCAEAGVAAGRVTPVGVEAVVRRGPDADFLFLIDHAGDGAEVEVAEGATELLGGERVVGGSVRVPAGGVAVVREPRGRQ